MDGFTHLTSRRLLLYIMWRRRWKWDMSEDGRGGGNGIGSEDGRSDGGGGGSKCDVL
jgi:hypothetical protein